MLWAALLVAELLGGSEESGRLTERLARHPIFWILLAIMAIVLGVTTVSRAAVEWRYLTHPNKPAADGSISLDDVGRLAGTLRPPSWWSVRAADDHDRRFLRHPWGRWAGVALHFGLTMVISAGALISATAQSGVLVLAEGEDVPAGATLSEVRFGPLAEPLVLSTPVRLEGLHASWWPNGDLQDVKALLRLGPDGDSFSVGINRLDSWHGLRFFQTTVFGRSFLLQLQQEDEQPINVDVQLASPTKLGEYSYRDITLDGIDPTIRLKYTEFDVGGVITPALTVRLETAEGVVGQADLLRGAEEVLGEYRLTYVDEWYWDQVVISTQAGEEALVVGLVITCLGAIGLYTTRPAEVYAVRAGDSWSVTIRTAGRFGAGDREDIAAQVTRQE